MMGRPVAALELTDCEEGRLRALLRRRKTGQGMATRAQIILHCARGLSNKAVAAELGVSQHMVGKWRRRFVEQRLDGLYDEPRPGGPRKITDAQVEDVIVRTLETKPANATHWSSREMERASGVSATSVQRIWRAFGLQPHRVETFKLSKDPLFIDKVRDVVALHEPARARYR